jgi:eukaryotic-like serine/threonine-protein kinase
MKLVGRFQVTSRVGRGAMASVYRAHDPEIQRDLAIKILNQQYRRDPECAERFLREARAAGALSHPNIVTIYDVGVIQGLPYIAMELLDGQPLDKAIETRGAFPVEEVLHIGAQLADALRYAHELGIVHRDIKPSNIILCADGRTVKILDFGIARVAESGSQDSETVKTQIGQVLGTPRYMSPEQALGQPLDGRSDLFSVGVVLYELITGKPAFNGTSVATLALQITTQQPEPIRVIPECPRGLRFIIDKLLAKNPEKRFTNGAQLKDALSREAAACKAAGADDKARRLPLHLRFTLLACAVVAIVLSLGVGAVLDRQYQAMERVAITSGSSIATFVASNTALHVVENATRPDGEADWLPVQAFVKTASADENITGMLVVDKVGIVRGAADPSLVGRPYQAPLGQRPIGNDGVALSTVPAPGGESFRFTRPIVYAGREVGRVDVSVRKDELQATAGLARLWLFGFSALMMAVILGLSFIAGRVVLSPVRRLNTALRDAAAGNLDFRISHGRRDEFGELFDNFNTLVSSVQKSPEPEAPPATDPAALLRSVLPPAAPEPELVPHLDATVLRA